MYLHNIYLPVNNNVQLFTKLIYIFNSGRIIITGIAEMDNTTEFTISGTDLLRIRENNFSIYRYLYFFLIGITINNF